MRRIRKTHSSINIEAGVRFLFLKYSKRICHLKQSIFQHHKLTKTTKRSECPFPPTLCPINV